MDFITPVTPFQLVYPDKSGCTQVLLIENGLNEPMILYDSANEATFPILYSSTSTKNDLLGLLRSNFTSIDKIALAFNPVLGTIKEFLDNQLFFPEEFTENVTFIIDVIKEFSVKNIDYLGCNTLNDYGWKEYYAILTEKTGVMVGASNNYTGNIQYGGDWVMETNGEDIEFIYFTQSIEYYKYLLDTPSHSKSIIINQDNTLYGVGNNQSGDLGLGLVDTLYVNSLTFLPIVSKTPLSISCGKSHTVVLMTDGTIYGTGDGSNGQLANIGKTSYFKLMTNSTGKTPKALSCGDDYTIVLMTDNTIYGVGINSFGGLANISSGSNSLTLMTNSTGKTPSFIKCGSGHTLVLMTDGTIYGTGLNGAGQLGIGNNTNQTSLALMTNSTGKTPSTISCGNSYTIVLMTDGTIYGTGNNTQGQLGIGNNTSQNSLTLITNSAGKTSMAIACGRFHTIVLMTDGTIYGTGNNISGQLGTGNTTTINLLTLMANTTGKTPSFISAGCIDTIVVMSDGSIYAVGKILSDNNIFSTYTLQLITNSTGKILNSLFPIVVSTLANITDSSYFIVVMTDNSIYGMGSVRALDSNCLGLGTSIVTNFMNINVNNIPKYVSIGNNHSMVLMKDGTIYGTGNNTYGQLGLGNTTNKTSFTLMPNSTGKTPSFISCGDNNTIVLMTDGAIYGIGINDSGQLANISSGSTSLELMTNSTGKTPRAISCGSKHTIVLMTDGTIYGTGINTSGELGIGNNTSQTSLTLMTNSTGKTPSSISCGVSHTMVLMTDGTIYGTGINTSGGLGIGNNTSQTSLTLMTNSTGKTPSFISCGTSYTMVLMTDGTIYGTGINTQGELGIGNNTSQTTLSLMTNSTGKTPLSISCASNSTFVLMTDGTIYGTGNNTYGQLGLGNTTPQTTIQLVPNLTSVNKLSGSNISIITISDYINNVNMVCFKEGSKILTDKGYIPIEQLRKGDKVKTLLQGFVPIDMIAKRDIFHVASAERIKDQLYVCSDEYPEVFEPLVITGCHSILVYEYANEEERSKTIQVNGNTYMTDDYYRLPSCVDERTKVYHKPGTYTIYHIALEHTDYYMNYGVYANGLLVETCSKRYLKELSNMEILG